MSNFNINKCNINVKGKQCSRNRKSGCTVLYNNELVCMCQQHYNLSATAFAIPVYHFANINPVQEDIMNSNIRTIEIVTEELNAAKAQMKEFQEHPYTTNAIAWGDAVGDRIDMLTEELKSMTQTITNQKEETMKTDTGIFTINYHEKGTVKCVKCSKELPISDPNGKWDNGAFHSIEDLRKCMGAPEPAYNESNVSWDRENFPTRKDAMNHMIAQKRGIIKFNEKTNRWDWFAKKS